jgi:hypothetical protein
MFELHSATYAHTGLEKFKRDLNEKQWSILLMDDQGRIQGYSSVEIFEAVRNHVPCRVLYSGDTLVVKEHRQDYLLAVAFVHCIHRVTQLFKGEDIWWLLTTKGFRTYRFLPVYFKQFFPRYDAPMPGDLAEFLDALGRRKFGNRFNSQTGIAKAGTEGDCLSDDEAGIPKAKTVDPHVSYFVERNPRYAMGDELVCLARLSEANLKTGVYQRFLSSSRVSWEIE